ATAIDIPKRTAEEAIDAYVNLAPPGADVVVGGQSYGGRVASLAAAREAYAGLVCFSYPLHRPGHPETAAERIAHWPDIECPVLLLSVSTTQLVYGTKRRATRQPATRHRRRHAAPGIEDPECCHSGSVTEKRAPTSR